MSEDFHTYTRVNRYEKQRKNTKAISWLLVVGSLLVVLLIVFFIFGGGDDEEVVQDDQQQADNESQTEPSNGEESESASETDVANPEDSGIGEDSEGGDSETAGANIDPNDMEVETVPFDDDNVLNAYTANWEPIGTEMEEPFTFSWQQGEQDWNELVKVCALATGLGEDDIIDYWVEGAGEPNKVIATVTNLAKTEVYRVYVSWVPHEGWQPSKVEILKENDKVDNFSSNNTQDINDTESTDESTGDGAEDQTAQVSTE